MCFTKAASDSRRRRKFSRSLRMSPPRIVATLDLSNEVERELHGIIEHFHSGKSPTLRCHGMRRAGDVLFEVVQWFPARTKGRSPIYSLVTWSWNMATIGLCWRYFPTLTAAREAFASLNGQSTSPPNLAAPAAANAAQ